MRTFLYTYQDSAGLKHEGIISAPGKDEAYSELRRQGIRPIRVTERIAPVVRLGLKGLRKRDMWLLLLVALTLGVAVALWATSARAPQALKQRAEKALVASAIVGTASPRHFVDLGALDLASLLPNPTDRYLARYAMPGETLEVADSELTIDGLKALVVFDPADPAELVELKRILVGIKDEARKYVAMSNGLERLAAFLDERQAMERTYRAQILGRVQSGALAPEDAAAILSPMGFKP